MDQPQGQLVACREKANKRMQQQVIGWQVKGISSEDLAHRFGRYIQGIGLIAPKIQPRSIACGD
jgi:hypothetical protein